ncbi:hypothetical protein NDU88_005260 [Pleurodeles waltl]|uniref:Uncharacterized protein n=1 Tax=Pleurodeles waltl TaxID=8319 RepID=A0AAV7WY94_PLEWA|nr:hypothetical protein NDU88_005260 [Pleurodeles waltl]
MQEGPSRKHPTDEEKKVSENMTVGTGRQLSYSSAKMDTLQNKSLFWCRARIDIRLRRSTVLHSESVEK